MARSNKTYGGASGPDARLAAEIETAGSDAPSVRSAAPPQLSPREMYARLTHGRVTAPEELPLHAPAGMDTRSGRGYARYVRA